jgi:hypothetical protein
LAHTPAQAFKVTGIGHANRCRRCARKKQAAQVLPIFVFANELAQVFAAGVIGTLVHLLIHKGLQGAGQRNIYGAHTASLLALENWQIDANRNNGASKVRPPCG